MFLSKEIETPIRKYDDHEYNQFLMPVFLVIKSHRFPHFPTQGSMPEYVMNSQFNGDFAGY